MKTSTPVSIFPNGSVVLSFRDTARLFDLVERDLEWILRGREVAWQGWVLSRWSPDRVHLQAPQGPEPKPPPEPTACLLPQRTGRRTRRRSAWL
jgi:hypothetical protein